ncbi:TARBP1 family protein [Megaselia abdita]
MTTETDQVFEISSTKQFKQSSHQTAENLHHVLKQNIKRYENDEELYKFLPVLHYSLQDWSPNDQKWFLDQILALETSALKLKLLLQFIKSLPTLTKNLNFCPIQEIVQSTEDDEILSIGLICLKETKQLPTLIKKVLPKLQRHPKLVSFALAESIENCVAFRSESFWSQMPSLLEPTESRKYAIYIIEVILEHFQKHKDLTIQIPKYMSINENRNKIFHAWSTYLTILKNLDEKQSHLILPSLENLPEVRSLPKLWNELLLRQLLKHNNSLVIRWTVKHILENFTGNDLSLDLYKDFMTSLNNIFLYSSNSSPLSMESFISSNISLFFKSFETVDWKGVPMSYCLRTLIKIKMEKTVEFPKEIPIENLLSIAKNVRKVQHRSIRNVLRVYVLILFSCEFLAELNLQDFALFIEALYNKNELVATFYSNHFCEKFQERQDFEISETVYSLISRRHSNFISKTDDLKYFTEKEYAKGFLRIAEERKVDKDVRNKSLEEVLEDLEGFLNSCSVDGVQVIVSLLSDTKIPEHLLELVFKKVAEVVGRFGSDAPYDCVSNILRYCRKFYPEKLLEYAKNLLSTDMKNPFLAQEIYSLCFNDELIFTYAKDEALEFLLSGLTYGDFQSGNDKIEFDYILDELRKDVNSPWKNYTCFPSQVRSVCLNACSSNIKSEQILKELKENLVQKSIEISLKKPRYFKNSPHHRLKLRVICALAVLHRKESNRVWDDRLLKTVFEENNQTDVTMIAERIVAMSIPKEVLMDLVTKLPTMTPSTQVSLFSICFMFCKIHYDNVLSQQFVQTFLPYTMGQNFITRLNAQITIFHLVTLFDITEFTIIKTAILESFKTQTNQEVNFMKLNESIQHTIWSKEGCIDDECLFGVMYSTDSPVDEFYFGLAVQMYSFDPNGSKFCQRMITIDDSFYSSRKKIYAPAPPPEEQKLDEFAITSNVQRKANPIQVSTDFKVFQEDIEENEREMIVVASLIDKIPNLGGIARSCEVLGIENLVISSLKFCEGTEFRNVSMTAEKYLNLSEMKPKFLQNYLIEKKSQGYSIVGAEQTSNSVNFVGFKFPRKCVLVLG